MPEPQYRFDPVTKRYVRVNEPGGGGRAGGSGRDLRAVLGVKDLPPEPVIDHDPNTRDYLAAGVRGVSGLVPPGPWGAAAGGAGELIAEAIEGRAGLDWQTGTRVATQAALGAIPFGKKLSSAGQAVLRGSVLGGTGAAATDIAEQITEPAPTLSDLVTGTAQPAPSFADRARRTAKATAVGATIGGAAGGVSRKLGEVLGLDSRAGTPPDGYSPGLTKTPDMGRGEFAPRPGPPANPVRVQPTPEGVAPASGRVPYRPNTMDVPDPAGVPQQAFVTDDFRPTQVRPSPPDTFVPSASPRDPVPEPSGPIGVQDRGPDTFQPSFPDYRTQVPEGQPIGVRPYEPAPFELANPGTLAPEGGTGLAGVLGVPKPRLTATETGGILAGRQKLADKAGVPYGDPTVPPGRFDDLDRAGVEYQRTQAALRDLKANPNADPAEVARMQQAARELGARLQRGARGIRGETGEADPELLHALTTGAMGGVAGAAAAPDGMEAPSALAGFLTGAGGYAANRVGNRRRVTASGAVIPDEILPPEHTSVSRPVDPLTAIEPVEPLPYAQVRPQAKDLAGMFNLNNVPTSKRGARTGTDVAAPVEQEQVTPQYATKIASDVLGKGKVPASPNVSDEQASSLRRLFSERGAGGEVPATVRPETSEDLRHRGLPAEFSRMAGSELGEANPDILHGITGAAIGAGVGNAFTPEDHRGVGTLAGAAVGAGAVGAYRRPDLAEQYTTAGMLSSPKTPLKILGSNIFGPLIEAGKEAFIERDPSRVTRTLKELFSPATPRAFTDSLTRGHSGEEQRALSTGYAQSGPLAIPGRVIGALDNATKDYMGRAGFSPETAARVTMTAEPESPALLELLKWQQRHAGARVPAPFMKTLLNAYEQGLVNPVKSGGNILSGSGTRRDVANVAAATGAGALGYTAAENLPGWAEPFAMAAFGPYMAPAAIGSALSHTPDDASPTAKLVAMSKAAGQQMPLGDPSDVDPRQLISRAVPNLARDAAQLMDPAPARETSQGLFDPMIAKIPFLREYLKKKKAPKRD